MPKNHFLNIKKILEDRKENKTEIGKLLFPDNKFPGRAFSRVLTGHAELSASQVSILAERLGCEITELYEPDRWKWDDTRDGKHIFIYGTSFRVSVDTTTWETTIYHKDEIIKQGTYCGPHTPIGDFLDSVKADIQDWVDFA